jgi:hypothetical protein
MDADYATTVCGLVNQEILSCIIDAKQNRDVANVDIPGAFMQADMDELVHMHLKGTMVDLVVRLLPDSYEKHVTNEGNKKKFYTYN